MQRVRHPDTTLSERAYRAILDKILKQELPLGAAISRRKLAAELGMSFLPVSEAIQRLESDGLVESRPRVGTRVRIPTARDLRERYIMREALETQSARLFAEKASADERLELRAMAARLDELMAQCAEGDRDQEFLFGVQTYHLSLHMRIAECGGCGALCDAIQKNQVLIYNWLYDTAAHFHSPPNFHSELMEAVAGGDPDIAAAAMRRHVRHGMEEIQIAIASQFAPAAKGSDGKPAIGRPAAAGAWRVKPRGRRARVKS